MDYVDRIFGKFKIEEPIILEIINSPVFQRLKGVDQAGYRPLWVKPDIDIGEYDNTRFAHSLGVFLLLRKYDASLEEQIAGLIHDISHTTFSHCIDYALGTEAEKKHDYQDNTFESYVRDSMLPDIFKKYSLDLEFILNDKNFSLKEKMLPGLCADRIDYSLRDAVIFEEISKKELDYFLDNLTTENGNWVFKSFRSAKKFAELFSLLNSKYYASFMSAFMLKAVGDYLKHAMNNKYINDDDLYTTDKEVLEKINKHLDRDKKLGLFFDRMNNRNGCKNSLENYDVKVFCKSRAVDPLFRENGEIKKVSDVDEDWGEKVKEELKPKKYYLKFEK